MSHDVFISHASGDRLAAEQICAALEGRGLRCWIAPRNVLAGEDWGMAILAAIAAARCMVVVIGAGTHDSVHVKNEIITASSQRLPLLPVRVMDVPLGGALRLHLAAWHWLDAFPPPVGLHGDALATGVRACFADSDATVNMMLRHRPMGVAPPPPRAEPPPPPPRQTTAPMASGIAAPATWPGAMPPAPAAAPTRGPMLARVVVVATALLALGALGWLLMIGPGRDWAFGSAATAPRAAPATVAAAAPATIPAVAPATIPAVAPPAAPIRPVAGAVIPISADQTPPPGGRPSTPTPSPDQAAPILRDGAPPGPAPGPTAQPRAIDEVAPRQGAPQQAAPQRPAPQQAAPPPGTPRPATVTIINASSQDIDQLYISPVTDGGWGEDWLGMAQILPGQRVLAPRPAGGCLFDLRVVYRDRRTEELRRHDICAMTELRFDASKARAAGSGR